MMSSSVTRALPIVRCLVGSLRRRGLRTTLESAFLKSRHLALRAVDHWAEWLFDIRHGVETRGIVRQPAMDAGVLMYQGIRPRAFRRALSQVPPSAPTSLFLDFGCGKGRALLLAASAGFRRVIGVEICADLARVAERNASVWSRAQTGTEIRILNRNVLDYELPDEPFVLFLYNPFRADVLAGVVSRLERSLASNPRDVTVVYANPSARHVLDESPAFALVASGRARRPGNAFVVYRAQAVLPDFDRRDVRGRQSVRGTTGVGDGR